MYFPSFTLILSSLFLGYIAYSIYTVSQLFAIPPCRSKKNCLESYLNRQPKLQLDLFTSTHVRPLNSEVQKVYTDLNFDYTIEKDV